MATPRTRRDQRGNSLLLAMIVMSALGTLGSLTVVSVQEVLKASTNERSQAIAMYAAESGAAAAMVVLRNRYPDPPDPTTNWSAYVHAGNTEPLLPMSTADLPSNGALPGTPNNLLSADQNAWYSVTIRNNQDDPGFSTVPPGFAGNDTDGQVIIRSTGHGPQGSLAIIEWEVRRTPAEPPPPAPPRDPPLPPPQKTTPLILVGWRVLF